MAALRRLLLCLAAAATAAGDDGATTTIIKRPPNGIVDAHIHLINTDVHAMIPAEEAYLTKYHVYRSRDIHDYNVATGSVAVDYVVPIECGVVNASIGLLEVAEWVKMATTHGSPFKYRSEAKPRIQSIIPFAPIDDGFTALALRQYLDELDRTAAPLTVVGVRRLIQIEPEPDAACRASFKAGLEILHQSKPEWFFDVGIRAVQLPCIIELVRAYPTLQFVIDHHAKPGADTTFDDWRHNIATLAASPNVVIKVSGLVNQVQDGTQPFDSYTKEQIRPYVQHVIQSFGYDRAMFASNWFVVETFSTWQSWFELVLEICHDDLQATPDQIDALFRKTAMRIHKLH